MCYREKKIKTGCGVAECFLSLVTYVWRKKIRNRWILWLHVFLSYATLAYVCVTGKKYVLVI